LTGTRPFEGATLTVMRCHVEKAPPPLTQFRPGCPAALQAAVLRMLEKRPERRFATMAEAVRALGGAPLGERDPVREDIRRLVEGVPKGAIAPATPVSPPIVPSPDRSASEPTVVTHPPRRRRLTIGRKQLLLGGGVVALVVLLAVLVLRSPAPEAPAPIPSPPMPPARIEVTAGGDLAAAVAAVAAGGEVALAAGEYRLAGPLRVMKPVRIVGRGRDSTRLVSSTADSVPVVVVGGADQFELADLELRHVTSASVPALRIEALNAAISQLRVVGNGNRANDCGGMGPGIAIVGGSRARVVRSEIRGFCSAIRVSDSAAPELSGNTLTENAAGIRYQGSAGGSAYQNKIFRNGDGIYVEAGRPILDANEVTRNRAGLSGLVRPDLRNNRIVNNIEVDTDIPRP